jgi:nucleotide-binding universal stress UspA family protein
MYRTVLVALDGSPRETIVFQAAIAIAKEFGAALHVCRAVPLPVGIPPAVWALPTAELDAVLVAEANRAIARHVADTSLPIAGTHVRIGQPADVVLDVSEEVNADLIVIGAHGYHVLERVIGTTASKIVHRARCSVLVARQ